MHRQCFDSGKLFARRQSLLDAVSQLFWMRGGERSSIVHVVQLLVMSVVNFTTGMLLTMFLFTCRLPSYIYSFGPPLVRSHDLVFYTHGCLGVGLLHSNTQVVVYCFKTRFKGTNILSKYPSPQWSGIGFFLVAMWSAASVVAAALVLMYSAGVGMALSATHLLLLTAHRQQRLQRPPPGVPGARALRTFRSFDSGLMLRSASSVQRVESSSYEYRPVQ